MADEAISENEVPSLAHFEEWFQFIAESPTERIARLLDKFDDAQLAIDQFRAFFLECDQIRESRLVNYRNLSVCKWLYFQPAYKRARKIVFARYLKRGRARTLSSADAIEEALSRAIGDGSATGFRLISRLKRELSDEPWSRGWQPAVLNAIFNYLYSHHAQAQADALSKGLPLLEEFERIARQLMPIVEPFVSSTTTRSVGTSYPGASTIFRAADGARALREAILEQPIQRKMVRARDFLFVQQVRIANLGAADGKPKPDGIAALMELPFFAEPYDARHIARICQTLKKRATERSERRNAGVA